MAFTACGDLPHVLAHDPSPRQAREAWQDPEAWRESGLLSCDARPPPAGRGRPCRHLLQMPPVHAAMVRCQMSGGLADARGRCACPAGSWQVIGGGCAPRPEVRCTGGETDSSLAALLAPVAPRPARRRRTPLGSPAWRAQLAHLAVGGARLSLHLPSRMSDEKVLGHLHRGVLAPAGALIAHALGPAVDGHDTTLSLAVVDRASLADALAAIGTRAWRAATDRRGQPPPQVTFVGPAWQSRRRGALAERCRGAWEEAGLPAPEVGVEAWCARLLDLKQREALAGRARGSAQLWRAVYLHEDVPTAEVATVVAHPAEGPSDDTAEFLVAGGAILQRRLHLRDPRVHMVVFLSPQGAIWAVVGGVAASDSPADAAVWADFSALPRDDGARG